MVNLGIETDVEDAGIVLDNPFYCGDCISQMDVIGEHIFQCPKCGSVYRDA